MAAISATVRNFVRARIGDTVSGWNYWIGQVWTPIYNLDSSQLPQINIDNPGLNFFSGQISPQLIDATGNSSYPVCVVYGIGAENQHLESPAQFGGIVRIGIDWWEAFPSDAPPMDAETSADAIEDAMYTTFNSQSYYAMLNGTGASYNNELNAQRGPLQLGGDNWLRLSRYVMTFHVVTGA